MPLMSALNPALCNIKTVTSGNSHDNSDVQVTCDVDSGGNITVDPETGTATSDSNIVFKTGAKGSVAGIEAGDTVSVRSNGRATVSGTGGTISIGGTDARVTVTNTAPVGGSNITVTTASGTTVTVPPGSTTTVST